MSQVYWNARRIDVNALELMYSGVRKRTFDVWDYFVGKEYMYMRTGLHLSGKQLIFVQLY